MNRKQTRSEFAANVQQVMGQASLRQFGEGLSSIAPAPVRVIAKRSFFGYTKSIFSSLLKGK